MKLDRRSLFRALLASPLAGLLGHESADAKALRELPPFWHYDPKSRCLAKVGAYADFGYAQREWKFLVGKVEEHSAVTDFSRGSS